jgi:hypothetical protein
MLDPFTSIGLAGNIFQFVDFAGNVLSGAQNIYNSENNATDANQELEDVAKHLIRLARRAKGSWSDSNSHFTQSSHDSTTAETDPIEQHDSANAESETESKTLIRLSTQCENVASKLLKALDGLKITNNKHRAVCSLKQAFLVVWKQDEIDDLLKRLDAIKTELHSCISERRQRVVEERLRELLAANAKLNAKRSEEIKALHSAFENGFEELRRGNAEVYKQVWLQLILASEKGTDYSKEQLVLKLLYFPTMFHRQDAISEEHAQTFQWIFNNQQERDTQPAVAFTEWLANDNRLYWVSGKPGSGKSTLMKFIAFHPSTYQYLKQWAHGDKLVVASFYFWAAARDPLQKSASGLLRSILFQILQWYPELIQTALPLMWKSNNGSEWSFLHVSESVPALLEAFRRVHHRLNSRKVKFCFFLDGLDEFHGQPRDIIELVNIFKQSENLKACVSSRPWNEFESSFGAPNPWKLHIHELTRNDIKLYVEDTLAKNADFKALQTADEKCPDLVADIVNAAQGVFLWVFLVVRSLLDGLTNADRVSDLMKRFNEMPRSLDEFFKKMLVDIEERYRQQSAFSFMVALEAVQQLPLIVYWFLDVQDPDYLANIRLQTLPTRTTSARNKQIKKRINARCKGLLQIVRQERRSADPMWSHAVGFLHRTVRDFFYSPDIQQWLQEWSADLPNTSLEICKAIVATLRGVETSIFPDDDEWHILTLEDSFFHHAALLEQIPSLDELRFAVIDTFISGSKQCNNGLTGSWHKVSYAFYCGKIVNVEHAAMYRCARAGLTRYIKARLHSVEKGPRRNDLLHACICTQAGDVSDPSSINVEMCRYLLETGLDPNGVQTGRRVSSWQEFLQDLSKCSRIQPGSYPEWFDSWYDAIKLLLEHGADLTAQVTLPSSGEQSSATEFLHNYLPKELFLALGISTPEKEKDGSNGRSRKSRKREMLTHRLLKLLPLETASRKSGFKSSDADTHPANPRAGQHQKHSGEYPIALETLKSYQMVARDKSSSTEAKASQCIQSMSSSKQSKIPFWKK